MASSPLTVALRLLAAQELLPTALKSAELREKISARVRQMAVFSAQQDRAEYLQFVKDITAPVLRGEMSVAEARTLLGDWQRENGWIPADGDDLTDHTSVSRRQLVIETRVEVLRGYGNLVAAQDEDALHQYPARELYRQFSGATARDWETRWAEAGGEFYGGRMIATVNDPVWQNLGDGMGGYNDTLGNPYPPFAFNSGMYVRDVERDEAVALGVIGADDEVAPADVELPTFEGSVRGLDAELQRDLAANPDLTVSGGVLRIKNRFDEAAHPRDTGGQFTDGAGADARPDQAAQGNGGVPPPSAPPKRISAADADAKLTAGFTEKSVDGREVKFGARMKNKLDKAADGAKRKEFLDWGREAVRSGNAVEVVEKGEARTVYAKTFRENDRDKGLLVIVDTADGEAFNLYRAKQGTMKKMGIANRWRGDEQGGQPPLVVRRAIAAADRAPDYAQITKLRARVKLFATALQIRNRVRKLQTEGLLS